MMIVVIVIVGLLDVAVYCLVVRLGKWGSRIDDMECWYANSEAHTDPPKKNSFLTVKDNLMLFREIRLSIDKEVVTGAFVFGEDLHDKKGDQLDGNDQVHDVIPHEDSESTSSVHEKVEGPMCIKVYKN